MPDRMMSLILIIGATVMASNPDHEQSVWRNLVIAGWCCYQAGICWNRNDKKESK